MPASQSAAAAHAPVVRQSLCMGYVRANVGRNPSTPAVDARRDELRSALGKKRKRGHSSTFSNKPHRGYRPNAVIAKHTRVRTRPHGLAKACGPGPAVPILGTPSAGKVFATGKRKTV